MATTKSRKKTAAKKATAKKAKPAVATKAKPTAAAKKAAAPKAKTAAAKKAAAPKANKAAVKRRPSGPVKAKASLTPEAAASKSRGASKKSQAASKGKASKASQDVPDFAEFPAGHVTGHEVTLCLACIFSLFTKQLGLAPRTAYAEIRGYAPTVEELTAREPQRPFFKPSGEKNPHCPYCEAPKRWHAPLRVYRIEGGRATDAPRRALVKRLPAKDGRFQIHEQKSTARQVFFEWLERLGQGLDFESDAAWLPAAAREYLRLREPQTDWAEAFEGVRQARRSQRLEEGWERDGSRLFLAPALYNDVLLVQYLVSRSQRHGGSTSEGRLTLRELVRRMRRGGRLEALGVEGFDEFEVFEQLVERLTGGDAPAKLHFVVDRRDLLDKAKEVYDRQTA